MEEEILNLCMISAAEVDDGQVRPCLGTLRIDEVENHRPVAATRLITFFPEAKILIEAILQPFSNPLCMLELEALAQSVKDVAADLRRNKPSTLLDSH
jgi:hypothetical protein